MTKKSSKQCGKKTKKQQYNNGGRRKDSTLISHQRLLFTVGNCANVITDSKETNKWSSRLETTWCFLIWKTRKRKGVFCEDRRSEATEGAALTRTPQGYENAKQGHTHDGTHSSHSSPAVRLCGVTVKPVWDTLCSSAVRRFADWKHLQFQETVQLQEVKSEK